jgi:hypothetical protein
MSDIPRSKASGGTGEEMAIRESNVIKFQQSIEPERKEGSARTACEGSDFT